MDRTKLAFLFVLACTVAAFGYLIPFVFFHTPIAQPQAGGLAQKIFYFHVPAAYALYLCGFCCFVGSAAYLVSPSERWNAVAQAGAECAVAFGAMVLVSGPLWAKKAWGVYWTWDPRLTTLLLTVLLYTALVVIKRFGGADAGEAERKFAAAFGVLGTVNLPIVHYSVKKWGGNHPTVITGQGGGLKHPDMSHALLVGFLAMTFLCIVLLWLRVRLATQTARIARLEADALASGALDDF